MVSLREELELVQNYLNIIFLLYKERLQIQFDIPENLHNLQVLRFIIQPILENAIKHGVEKQNTLITIRLKAEKIENCLFIVTENDGPSIAPERFDRLQFALEQENGPWYGGIGMMNVHKRIQLFYGRDYGISIHHRIPDGVITKLRLPVMEEN